MTNKKMIKNDVLNIKKFHKNITPEQLQEIFLNIARKVA